MTEVHERSGAVSRMLSESAACIDIIKGGDHMRKKGVAYLPKFPMESDDDYKARVAGTWLFNGVKKARDDMAGKVFEKPVILAEPGASEDLDLWCSNIDLEGRDLSNFANDVFLDGIQRGITFILVDAPRRDGDVTRGQAQALGLRPYFVSLTLDDVLGWKWENVNNAPTLMQLRISERAPKPDRGEYSDEMVDQVRVMDVIEGRVTVTLFQKDGRGEKWVQIDQYPTDFDRIMLVPFYTGRTKFMEAKPPLADIAEVNLAHWRVQSDKSNCLHKSLSPLLFMKQMGEIGEGGSAVVNSAGYGFMGNSDGADMKWVEISGAGIAEGREELRDLEKQMQWMGLQLIMQRTGVSTATGDAIDEGRTVTRLRMWADNLKDCLEQALDMMADVGGLSGVNTDVVVNKEFTVLGHLSMADVRDMFNSGAISRATYIEEAKRRGVLSEDVDVDDEMERMTDEGLSAE